MTKQKMKEKIASLEAQIELLREINSNQEKIIKSMNEAMMKGFTMASDALTLKTNFGEMPTLGPSEEYFPGFMYI